MLGALLAKASYELRLHEEARGDPERQLRLLKREYAFELMDIGQSEAQAGRLNALESMLEARGESTIELRGLVVSGVEVARTPERPAVRSTIEFGPQGSAPRPEPAAPAGMPSWPIHGTGMDTPVQASTAVDGQIAALEERLRLQEVEIAASKLQAAADSINSPMQFAEIVSNQTKLLESVLNKPRVPSLTIRVEPKVYWPKLGDDGPGGNEVEDFYEKLEDICSLANNGQGMSDKEMLVAMKSCLSGSLRKIYDKVVKANKKDLNSDGGPGELYRRIKNRCFASLRRRLKSI